MFTIQASTILTAIAFAALAQDPSAILWEKHIAEGNRFMSSGQYPDAEKAFLAALTAAEKFGSGDQRPAITMNNLACLNNYLGRYTDAERYAKQALAASERILGSNHPDVALVLQNLAGAYYNQKLFAKAEPLYRRALEIDRKTLGDSSPETADLMKNLADLLSARHEYEEADRLYREALAIWEKTAGPESAKLAMGLNDLGRLRCDQHLMAEAAPLLERAVRIWELTSPGHPSFATGLVNLAVVYSDLGRLQPAAQLFERALPILLNSLGQEHPDLGTALAEYAHLLRKMHRSGPARKAEKRAKSIFQKAANENLAARHTIDVRDASALH